MRRAIAAVLAALLLTGCATFGLGHHGGTPVSVEVHNDFGGDVGIYAINAGQISRVGTVTALGTETLRISGAITSATPPPYSIRLLVLPLHDGGSYVTGQINVDSSDVIVLHVGSTLTSSRWRLAGSQS